MKHNHPLDLTNIFFEALQYPQFARPNFFINKQKESEWSKGVYLTALDEVYHTSFERLQIHFAAQKRNLGNIKFEEFEIPKKILFGDDDEQLINRSILDELHYAIHQAFQFDPIPKLYSPYQIITFVDAALLFIKNEFYEQAKKQPAHTHDREQKHILLI